MVKMKILIIDDNQDITTMLAKYLSLKGHESIVSNDGRNGLTMIENGRFDVILLDLAMPEFTGVDIIENLNKSGKIKGKKIIVFTASSVKDDVIQDLIKKGAHSCIRKPVKLDILLKTIGV